MTNQQTKEQEKLERAEDQYFADLLRAVELVKELSEQKPTQDPNKIYWKG